MEFALFLATRRDSLGVALPFDIAAFSSQGSPTPGASYPSKVMKKLERLKAYMSGDAAPLLLPMVKTSRRFHSFALA